MLVLWPLALVLVLVTPKYRGRIKGRLGFGLGKELRKIGPPTTGQRFWVHALSVGEVASVVALVRGLRKSYPEAQIIMSTTTRSGAEHARQRLGAQVDLFVAFPLDHILVVRHFLTMIRPDLYVQVETDFWPNFLALTAARKVPALLVNGRVSATTFDLYQRFAGFFRFLFGNFRLLAMQTKGDAARLVDLGLPAEGVVVFGNLKIDALMPEMAAEKGAGRGALGLPDNKRILVAGSTHRGEEEELIACYQQLRTAYDDIFLVLALRNVERGAEVAALARTRGLNPSRRSHQEQAGDQKGRADLLIVDTMGELPQYYREGSLVFVGGSLVAAGGHNPLEAAIFSCPVSFGPHMEDFADLSHDMLAFGGAVQVATDAELRQLWHDMLADEELRQQGGKLAHAFVISRQGVTNRHLEAIARLLESASLRK
ncbi:MAG: 3-deoxy-D-manno-octulosonic acid transferase [Thermodesulfobacteriota bacterium]